MVHSQILAMFLSMRDFSFSISALSSLISFTFASSLIVGLLIIFFARLAYLRVLRVSL